MGPISRRLVSVLAIAALGLAACQKSTSSSASGGGGGSGSFTADEVSLGNPNAKVTVVEYASVACPFCAHFNNDVFPGFKAKFIDTGKIHYVFREMLVGSNEEVTFAAAGFLMARCAGPDKYFNIVDAIFHAQDAMYQSGDIRGGLLKIAESAGMTEKQFTDCVDNADALKALQARVDKATAAGIDSTPSFVINGKKLEGEPTEASLEAAIHAAGG